MYSENQLNALARASGFALSLLSWLSWAKERRHPRSVARDNVRKSTARRLEAVQPLPVDHGIRIECGLPSSCRP